MIELKEEKPILRHCKCADENTCDQNNEKDKDLKFECEVPPMGLVPSEDGRSISFSHEHDEDADKLILKQQDKFGQLLALLKTTLSGGLAMGPSPGDWLSLGFLVGAVEGLAPGFYLLDREGEQVGCVAEGQLVRPMAAACLDQAWLKNAGVHFLFMLNPERLAAACGPRGYRYAMVRAGFLGQLVYLGATALGLGACGIGAIYDDEARNLLRLNDGWALGYLVAAGVVKRTK